MATKPVHKLPPSVEARVRRILARAARRLLAERAKATTGEAGR
jgi:hypothetical protein